MSRLWARTAVAGMLALSLAGSVRALPPGQGQCYAVVTVAIVCIQGSCSYTTYVDDYWCTRTIRTDVNPRSHNPADTDFDLIVDSFQDVVATNDPCAYQFDDGDRLGSNLGGPSTSRPGHTGVDLQADRYDDVATVGHGHVSYIGYQYPTNPNKGCGYMMEVVHINGDRSTYCHLEPNSEKWQFQDFVRSGTVIAQADSTGNSTGHHLHLIYKTASGQYKEFWDASPTMEKPSAGQQNGGC